MADGTLVKVSCLGKAAVVEDLSQLTASHADETVGMTGDDSAIAVRHEDPEEIQLAGDDGRSCPSSTLYKSAAETVQSAQPAGLDLSTASEATEDVNPVIDSSPADAKLAPAVTAGSGSMTLSEPKFDASAAEDASSQGIAARVRLREDADQEEAAKRVKTET